MNHAFKILIFIFSLSTVSGCKSETKTPEIKIINYPETVINRTNKLKHIQLDSISHNGDTMKYFFTNLEYNYFSEIEFNQFFRYTFQDFSTIVVSSHNWLKIYYNMPKRDTLGYHLMIDDNLTLLKSNLNMFNIPEFKSAINKLFNIDSEYVYQNVIESLNRELTDSKFSRDSTEFDFLGIDTMEFILQYLKECQEDKSNSYRNLVELTLSRMKERDKYGISVINELEDFFKKICS